MGVAARLTAYALALLLVFGVAWFVGGLVRPSVDPGHGPAPSGGGHDRGDVGADHGMGGTADRGGPSGLGGGPDGGEVGNVAAATDGLASAAAGYRLALADPTFVPGAPGELRFVVFGPHGRAVTAFATTPRDPRPLHAVVVRRDAAGFQRLDPVMDPDGTWRSPLRLPAPGVWRVFVDTTPTGGPTLVLGVDLFAAGPFAPFTFPPSRTAEIGGFQLRLDGDLVPGVPSQVFATVSRAGAGVTDLQPYLGAFGRLVALREGDLAYAAAAASPAVGDRAGPAVAFTATVPSAGTYRLFLQFRVADVMHTAEFTVPTRNP
jgi:hypothetical protein